MMRTFKENQNRDIFMDEQNQIPLESDINAVSQSSKSAIEAQRGEMIYAQDDGMPLDSVIWSGTPSLQQFEFFARQEFLKVPNVTEVSEFNAEIEEDVVTYTATIKTTFGETTTSGSL